MVALDPGGSSAQAQDGSNDSAVLRARRHFVTGKKAFESGDFATALREFEAGYQLEPRPGFLLNMGHAARRMGDLEKARTLYKDFLRSQPAGDERRSAERALADIERRMASSAPPGADEDGATADADKPDDIVVPAVPEPPVTPEPLVVSPDRLLPTDPDASSDDAASAARGASSPFYTRWWFWGGIAALAAGAAGVLIYDATRPGSGVAESGSWGSTRL